MHKTSKYIISASLAVLTLAGCGNDDIDPEKDRNCPKFMATIDSTPTRAYDQSWDPGDEIGITGCERSNICYSTVGGEGKFTVKTSGQQIYFQDEDEMLFTAYYPWTNLGEDGETVITADTKEQRGQKKFDFLWAQGSGKKDAPNVSLQFSHKMTKVTFTVKPGEGMTYDEIKAAGLSLSSFGHSGSFNTASGSTTVEKGNGEPWVISGFANYDNAKECLTFSLILFPQTLDKPLDFMAELNVPDGKAYHLRAEIDFTMANRTGDGENAKNEWVAGRHYNLGLTLHKTAMTLDRCTINSWTTVSGGEIIVD